MRHPAVVDLVILLDLLGIEIYFFQNFAKRFEQRASRLAGPRNKVRDQIFALVIFPAALARWILRFLSLFSSREFRSRRNTETVASSSG